MCMIAIYLWTRPQLQPPWSFQHIMYRIAGKFGGELNLAVWRSAWATVKLKSAKISYSHIYIWWSRTEPPNLNPPMAIWDPTTKFNSHQYFRLYGIKWKKLAERGWDEWGNVIPRVSTIKEFHCMHAYIATWFSLWWRFVFHIGAFIRFQYFCSWDSSRR